MRYARAFMTAGLLSATMAGCGGSPESDLSTNGMPPAFPTPLSYDISNTECDASEAVIVAADAFAEQKELTTKALADTKHVDVNIVTGLKNRGPEIVNPLIITCDGVVDYVLGLDRGFSAQEAPHLIVAQADRVNFSRVDFRTRRKPQSVSLRELKRYIITTTVVDPGPAPYGVSGLVSAAPPVIGFGIMP